MKKLETLRSKVEPFFKILDKDSIEYKEAVRVRALENENSEFYVDNEMT
jgi:hypothetical protein